MRGEMLDMCPLANVPRPLRYGDGFPKWAICTPSGKPQAHRMKALAISESSPRTSRRSDRRIVQLYSKKAMKKADVGDTAISRRGAVDEKDSSRHIIIMGIIFRPNSGNLYGKLLREIWTVVVLLPVLPLSQLRA